MSRTPRKRPSVPICAEFAGRLRRGHHRSWITVRAANRPVRHQAAARDELPVLVNRGQAVPGRQCDDQPAMTGFCAAFASSIAPHHSEQNLVSTLLPPS
jgi:hypothetical protein